MSQTDNANLQSQVNVRKRDGFQGEPLFSKSRFCPPSFKKYFRCQWNVVFQKMARPSHQSFTLNILPSDETFSSLECTLI